MNRQHPVPDLFAGLAIGSAPGVIELFQFDHFGNVGCLAHFSCSFEELAELGPLQLNLAGRREFVGAVVDVRQAVFHALPDRHHGLTGKNPVAQKIALRRFAEQLDAAFLPGFTDQFQDVRLLGAFARRFNNDLQRPAVRQPAHTIRTPLEVEFVEQLVGSLAVKLGPLGLVLLLVQRTLRNHRIVALCGEAEIQHLVDLRPVDPHRECAAEAHVTQQGAPYRVIDVEVGEQRKMRTLAGTPQEGTVVVRLLPLLEKGVVVELDVTRLQVRFTGTGLRGYQLAVCNRHHDAVDVGQLVALLVDPVEEGVAHRDEAVSRWLGGIDPGLQRRQLRVVELVHVVFAVVDCRPVAFARIGFFRLQHLGVVLLVKLLEVMRGPVDEKG